MKRLAAIAKWPMPARIVQADVAHAALASAPTSNEAFYPGKIAIAQFFVRNTLPKLTAVRGVIESLDNDIMRIPETAF
jgi:Acetyl-CoA dehydrogenase C-terminal like